MSERIEMPRAKCEVDGGRLTPCSPLDKAMAPEANHGQGLVFAIIMNFRTGAERHGVMAKSGEFKKRGLMLRFCPWCGTDIGTQFDQQAVGGATTV